MKHYIAACSFIVVFLSFIVHSRAQPSWQWGKSGGSIGDQSSWETEDVIDMATDAKGNVYVMATVYGLATVGTYTGIGNFDRLVVASWDCSGTLRWIKFLGSSSSCIGRGLETDTLGGVYISGAMYSIPASIGGPGYFDTDSTLDEGYKSMFVLKYDTAGVFQWLKMPQPDTVSFTNPSGIVAMSVAQNGDIYLYSRLTPGLYDNGAFAITTGQMYVLKYNANGVYQKVVPLDMTVSGSYSSGYGYANVYEGKFSRDPLNGRYYLCGRCDTAYFGYMSFGTTAITTPLYLASFDSNGNNLWAKQCIGNSLNAGWISGPALTDTGENVYIGGVIYSNDAWNGYFIDNDSFTTLTTSCPFVAKMDKNGNNIWVNNAESQGGHNYAGIALANNIIACTGPYGVLYWDGFYANQFYSGPSPMVDHFLVRMNATTGKVIGFDSLKSSYGFVENANFITSDKNGNFFVGGRMNYDLFAGPDTLAAAGGRFDWFVAKYGFPACTCTVPLVTFNTTVSSAGSSFTYTGTLPVDSVVWDFGDGSNGKGITVSHSYVTNGTYTVCAIAYNSCSYNLFCKEVTTVSTGIPGIPGNQGIFLYPNPAGNILHIDHAISGSSIEVYNPAGQLLLQDIISGSGHPVNVGRLSAGIYIIRIRDRQGAQQMLRFVKE